MRRCRWLWWLGRGSLAGCAIAAITYDYQESLVYKTLKATKELIDQVNSIISQINAQNELREGLGKVTEVSQSLPQVNSVISQINAQNELGEGLGKVIEVSQSLPQVVGEVSELMIQGNELMIKVSELSNLISHDFNVMICAVPSCLVLVGVVGLGVYWWNNRRGAAAAAIGVGVGVGVIIHAVAVGGGGGHALDLLLHDVQDQ
ncbi:uncharacterized protein G2W53_000144 [Senna tora]|uniref:Uncharacterized protein n=1 Tax=Senna tora TaxID=362788 RepID=A0A835CI73_9FABA|nr:uncharacterized protein G2W53_000144 [Senna tora]